MKYIVDLDGSRFEVNLDGDLARVDGGPPRTARLMDVEGSPERLLTIGADAHEMHRLIARREGPRGHYVLILNGRRYVVDALDERARAIRDLSGSAVASSAPRHLTAPMPGLVVRVNVSSGDAVAAGQSLVVMEAMKMENELRAPAEGKVKAVRCAVGTAVEKGTVLVEFE